MIGKVLGAVGATLAAAAIASAPIATAVTNPGGGGSDNGSQNANENAKSRGITLKDITVTKVVDKSSAIVSGAGGFAPNPAQTGLSNALSHLPAPPSP
jgi:NH3-dependent NAD+ synthetase